MLPVQDFVQLVNNVPNYALLLLEQGFFWRKHHR